MQDSDGENITEVPAGTSFQCNGEDNSEIPPITACNHVNLKSCDPPISDNRKKVARIGHTVKVLRGTSSQDDSKPKLVSFKRGKDALIHNKYIFWQQNVNADRITWRCKCHKSQCPVTCYTKIVDDHLEIFYENPEIQHNHLPNVPDVMAYGIKGKIREGSLTSNLSASSLIADATKDLSTIECAESPRPDTLKQVAWYMRKKRRRGRQDTLDAFA